MSEIIRTFRARVPMPSASSDDVSVPGFTNTYLAVQRAAERTARANERGMAKIARAIRQSSFPQASALVPPAPSPGVVSVKVY